jgi:hypothetical protein
MSSVVISGDTSGAITLSAPAVAGTNTITLPANTGTVLTTASTFGGTGPAFSARAASNQTISSGTWTKVTLDTEIFDTNSCFASSRFTPTVAGYYQINGQISIYGTTSVFSGAFYKNGSSDNQFFLLYDTNATQRSDGATGSYIVYLNGTTDYIELYGNQTSSGTVQFEAGGSAFACKMSGSLIRTA